MLVVLIIWVYLLLLPFIYGWYIVKSFRAILRIDSPIQPGFELVWLTGLTALSVYAMSFSLFAKIGLCAHLIMAAGAAILLVAFIHGREIQSIRIELRKLPLLLWALSMLAVSTILVNAIYRPANPDTILYHAQTIHWIESYSAVPGLANLNGRYAYNSAWFMLNALFSLTFLNLGSFHLLSSVSYLVFLGFLVRKIGTLVEGNLRISNILGVFLLPVSFVLLASDISSPGNDLPVMLFTWLLLLEWMEVFENREHQADIRPVLLVIISFFITTVKVSAFPILLLAIYYFIVQIRSGRYKVCLKLAGIVSIIFIPWMIRNVILSGYLIYPIYQIDLFNFDWKVPYQIAHDHANIIKLWARFPGIDNEQVLKLPMRIWVPIWFNDLSANQKVILLAAVIEPFLFGLIALLLHNKFRSVYIELRTSVYLSLVCLAGIAFWFFTAPDLRFGYGYIMFSFLLGAAVILYWGLKRFAKYHPTAVMILICALIAFQGSSLYRSIKPRLVAQHLVAPAGYIELPTQPCKVGNLLIWCSDGWKGCGYEPFPCLASEAVNVEPRGKNLEDGFRAIVE
jgi:hypothetical protein